MLIICLLYGITITTSCILYYYCACITIIHITASFILSLTRLHADDPGFTCSGWSSKIPLYQIFFKIILRLSSFSIHRYICDLFLLSYLSLFLYLSWSLTPFAGILVLISCWNYCKYCIDSLYWGLVYVREGISVPCMYVAIMLSLIHIWRCRRRG